MIVFSIEDYIMAAIWLAFFVVKVVALVDAAYRNHALYSAADKQSKPFWVIILVVCLAVHLLLRPYEFGGAGGGGGLLNLIGDVAALVYLLDVRPALRTLRQP